VKYTRNERFIKEFGKRLRFVRKEKGLSQETLAHLSDLELSQINRIELGKINTSLSQVAVICDALQIQPKVLFEFDLPKRK
jgi:transcriptional regulator with XRE-family HTH domain